MNSLILSLLLAGAATTTMPLPTITYQIVTNDFQQHNTYAFEGFQVSETPDYLVYALNIDVCDMRRSYYNIIDEVLLFNNQPYHERSFSFKKYLKRNQCLLTVRKSAYDKHIYRNYGNDYWYPEYNHLFIRPTPRIEIYNPGRLSGHYYSSNQQHRQYHHQRQRQPRRRPVMQHHHSGPKAQVKHHHHKPKTVRHHHRKPKQHRHKRRHHKRHRRH